jgi:hypothetical protein
MSADGEETVYEKHNQVGKFYRFNERLAAVGGLRSCVKSGRRVACALHGETE